MRITSNTAPVHQKPHPRVKGFTPVLGEKVTRDSVAKEKSAKRNRYADLDPARAVIEVIAAIAGSALTIGAMGAGGAFNRSRQSRDTVVRLTTAVENVASRLDEIHVDMKADRQQTYALFSELDRRVTKLEVKP